MNLVAFDPGETVGFASLTKSVVPFGGNVGYEPHYLIKWDMQPFHELCNFDWDCWEWRQLDSVVIFEEAFAMNQYVKKVVYEAIGGIKTMAALNGLTLVGQRPDTSKFVKARFFDGKEPRIAIHAREALYHIIFRLHTQKMLPIEEIERIVKACQEYTSPTGVRSNAVDASGSIKVLRS